MVGRARDSRAAEGDLLEVLHEVLPFLWGWVRADGLLATSPSLADQPLAPSMHVPHTTRHPK